MAVPDLDTWVADQRVGARQLNDNTYGPAAFLAKNRPTGCIYLSSDWTHDGTDNEQTIPLDAPAWLSGMQFADNAIVVEEPGIYLVTAVVAWNMDDLTTTYAAGRVHKNGSWATDYRDLSGANLTTSSSATIPIVEELLLQAGDRLTLTAYSPATTSRDLTGAAAREDVGMSCHLTATWVAHEDDSVVGALSTPRTWATSDVPTAAQMNTEVRDQWKFFLSPPRCKATGTASVPTATGTTVTLSGTDWDTDSSLSSNVLTLPEDGFYHITLHGAFTVTNSTGRRLLSVAYLTAADSDIRAYQFQTRANSGGYSRIDGTCVISASAGQKIRLDAYQDSGSTLSLGSAHLSYRWLGQVT